MFIAKVLRVYSSELRAKFIGLWQHHTEADLPLLRRLAGLYLRTIYCGKPKPIIPTKETIKKWEEKSLFYLEEGRKHGY